VLVKSFWLLALLLGVAVGVAACGGGEQIPSKRASGIRRDLNTIERGLEARQCEQTRPTFRRLIRRVRNLPSDVDRGVRLTLIDGVQRLEELFEAQCEEVPEPTPKPTPEPTPKPTPEPTPEPTPPGQYGGD
jgi:hypothetical protein